MKVWVRCLGRGCDEAEMPSPDLGWVSGVFRDDQKGRRRGGGIVGILMLTYLRIRSIPTLTRYGVRGTGYVMLMLMMVRLVMLMLMLMLVLMLHAMCTPSRPYMLLHIFC